jgi:hypothetical protein
MYFDCFFINWDTGVICMQRRWAKTAAKARAAFIRSILGSRQPGELYTAAVAAAPVNPDGPAYTSWDEWADYMNNEYGKLVSWETLKANARHARKRTRLF